MPDIFTTPSFRLFHCRHCPAVGIWLIDTVLLVQRCVDDACQTPSFSNDGNDFHSGPSWYWGCKIPVKNWKITEGNQYRKVHPKIPVVTGADTGHLLYRGRRLYRTRAIPVVCDSYVVYRMAARGYAVEQPGIQSYSQEGRGRLFHSIKSGV